MKKQKIRYCLNCNKMLHSEDDWYTGECLCDGHRIDNIRNHDWCKHWGAPSDCAIDYDYNRDNSSDVDINLEDY